MQKVPTVRPPTQCLCWKHTYLCSDHLVPGEFCTLRSVRMRRTSFWSRSRHISLKPFRWKAFCLQPLQNDWQTIGVMFKKKTTKKTKTHTIMELRKPQVHNALNRAPFLFKLSPCYVAIFSASHSRYQLLGTNVCNLQLCFPQCLLL